MKVVSYLSCLPKSNKKQEKIDALTKFVQGVKAHGDQGIVHHGLDLVDCNVAVILGWVHESSKNSPHLDLRRRIALQQQQLGRHVIIIDSNLFLYKDVDNPHHYLRYSFNGVFPNTGNYCDQRPNPTRWNDISDRMQIRVKPYRSNGSHILICLQRHNGWSMGAVGVLDWLNDTIATLRIHTKRHIVIRTHPGDKTKHDFSRIVNSHAGVSISPAGTSLINDLNDCWAVVNYNSSPTVGAAIEGVPVFVTDPERSQCREIANTDLSMIENPALIHRLPWLQRLAMFHWNFDDLETGQCWQHMKNHMR